ncbi:MAG: hypothetical protein K8T91_21410 [Planctomycetes bacterium]|nr:hypothetical protein [Planctomycetota bacterium]
MTQSSDTIEDNIAAAETAVATAAGDFVQLARAAADGREVTTEQIMAACERSKRTPGYFRQLVMMLQARAKIRERLATLPAVQEEYAALKQRIDEANAELDVAVNCHQAATAPLQFRREILKDEMFKLGALEQELLANHPEKEMTERLHGLSSSLLGLDAQKQRHLKERDRWRDYKPGRDPEDRKLRDRQIAECERSVSMVEVAIADVHRQSEELLREMREY